MYIGELARRSGATPKAIRLYEQLGLLGQIAREGSYRVYDAAQLQQVQLIRQAQRLGFSLTELAQALGSDPAQPDWRTLLDRIEAKRHQVLAEIARLRQLEHELGVVGEEIAGCLHGQPVCEIDGA